MKVKPCARSPLGGHAVTLSHAVTDVGTGFVLAGLIEMLMSRGTLDDADLKKLLAGLYEAGE